MFKFTGYLRHDGRIGVRNYILAIPASICASPLVTKLCNKVEEVVGATHQNGCCQIGPDYHRTNDVITKLCDHPNVGGVVFVALGCEGTPSESIVEKIRATGRPLRFIHIQNEGGSQHALNKAIECIEGLKEEVNKITVTREASVEDLVVGLECGGSDATSGLAANPSIGWVSDELVKHGAKVVLSETTELIGAEHVITKNVTIPEVKKKILAAVKRVEAECRVIGVDIRGSQPTPGNIQGGLTTIEEKSMGCAYKSGASPFIDYLEYGETIRKAGMSFMDTPGQDVESMTGLAAGGVTIFLFSTGRGSPVGFPTVPTIKITGNAETFRRMRDDIDVDASIIFDGAGLHQVGQTIYDMIGNVCKGEKTKSEITGYYEVSINKSSITL